MLDDRFPGRLRSELEGAGARIRVGFPRWMRLLVARDVVGLTLGRTIYLAPRVAAAADEEVARIVRHELAHVRQMGRDGLSRFLARYVVEYLMHRRAGMSHEAAYAAISYELEARDAEGGATSEADS